MFWLVLGMTIAVALACCILATVALPAWREGRPMFTDRGQHVFRMADDRSRAVAKTVTRRAGSVRPGERSAARGGSGAIRNRRAGRKDGATAASAEKPAEASGVRRKLPTGAPDSAKATPVETLATTTTASTDKTRATSEGRARTAKARRASKPKKP